MSSGELVGLVLTVVLIAGSLGAAIGMCLGRQRAEKTRGGARFAAAWARWLAARWALSRASRSLVVAFRALAGERSDSPTYRLREREAQRTRGHWSRAVDAVARSEAMLLVLNPEPHMASRVTELGRVGVDALRVAVEGTPADAKAFFGLLEGCDREAREFVRSLVSAAQSRHRPWPRWVSQSICAVERIVNRWSRPAPVLRVRRGLAHRTPLNDGSG